MRDGHRLAGAGLVGLAAADMVMRTPSGTVARSVTVRAGAPIAQPDQRVGTGVHPAADQIMRRRRLALWRRAERAANAVEDLAHGLVAVRWFEAMAAMPMGDGRGAAGDGRGGEAALGEDGQIAAEQAPLCRRSCRADRI
jgi:hypothetical protein